MTFLPSLIPNTDRFQPVSTVASLKALTWQQNGDVMFVSGYHTPGDGGGGHFRFDATSSATANGGTVLAPDVGNGRWLRIYSGAVNVRWFGAKGDGVTDDTAAIQAAVNWSDSAGRSVYVPGGVYLLYGTVTLPAGVVMHGAGVVGEYYNNFPMSDGTTILKNNDVGVLDGPAVCLSSCSGVKGILFKSTNLGSAVNKGIVSFGEYGETTTNVTAASIQDCGFTLKRTDLSVTDNITRAIYFPERSSGNANYFHRVLNCFVSDADVAVALNGQCNGNNLSAIVTLNCRYHYVLDGGSSECIENTFSGLSLFAMSALSPIAVGIKMTSARNNVFSGFATEMFGKLYEIDAATCTNNRFFGNSNEPTPSYAAGQFDLRYAPTENVGNVATMPFVDGTAGTRNTTGGGATFKRQFLVTGTMPQQNNNTGSITAGDADNKVIFRFPELFEKAQNISFFAKLKVFAYGAFGNGHGMVDVEFGYSMRSSSTHEGTLSIFRVDKIGNEISGLYFLTGVAADTQMGVALVGGNYGGHAFSHIRCLLDVTVFGAGTFTGFFSRFTNLMSIDTADVTENDVTDSISLLTVAEHTV